MNSNLLEFFLVAWVIKQQGWYWNFKNKSIWIFYYKLHMRLLSYIKDGKMKIASMNETKIALNINIDSNIPAQAT